MSELQRGLYRNTQGYELKVVGPALQMNGWPVLPASAIWVAEDYDDLFKTTQQLLVTAEGFKECGYELIEAAKDDE
jgi:hypothetical protein